jgi:predicted Zn finger-like uncharacterized protein
MLIVCPSCASEYIIDPAQIGADGRTVRCAACRGTFFVLGEPNVTEEELAETEEFNTFLATQAWPEPDPQIEAGAISDVRAAMRARKPSPRSGRGGRASASPR